MEILELKTVTIKIKISEEIEEIFLNMIICIPTTTKKKREKRTKQAKKTTVNITLKVKCWKLSLWDWEPDKMFMIITSI